MQTQQQHDCGVNAGLRNTVSLVLPAHAEAEVIERAINEARDALSQWSDDFEIIVVDDGSTDSTVELVASIAASDNRVRLIQHDCNIGYGSALRSGFQAAKMDLVAVTDSDCQFDLNELDRLIPLSKDYDIVCGYRMDRIGTPLRCLCSWGYNQLARLLLGTSVRDVDCALKLFRRDVVQNLEITTDGFLVNSELLTQAQQKGHSVVEVGVSHRPRSEGESTVPIDHIPKVFTGLLRYWWNAVQFPVTARNPTLESSDQDRHLTWCQVALLLIAALFVLTNLGYPLIDRDETRYAEIPREMLVTGNWLLPQLNFEPYYDKPPLLYWLCAISYSLFGTSEWSARLVPALASLLTLASTIWFGSRWFGRRVGLYAGIVLMLSVGFLFCSRYLLIDGVLTSLITLSLMTGYEAIRGDKVKTLWWLASAVLCGLAFLTKGPLALVLWLPPMFAFTWLSQGHAKPNLRHYAMLVGVTFAVAAPWFILVALQDDKFLTEFFVNHNVRRFAGEFHAKPFWYFLPVLLVAGHPWSFLTAPLTRFLLGRGHEYRSQRPPILGFLVLWSSWCFLFFSMSSCKLPTYLLPAAPALALIVGYYMRIVLHQSNANVFRLARFWSAKLATATTCVAALGFFVFFLSTQSDISMPTFTWALVWTTILVGSLLLLREDRNPHSAWTTSALSVGLLGLMVMHQLVPAYSRSETLLGEGSPLEQRFAETKHIATIAREFPEVPFYLNRSDIPHWSRRRTAGLAEFVQKHRESILVVSKRVPIAEVQSQLPDDASTKLIADRGPARLLRVRMPPEQTRLARRTIDAQSSASNR